MVDIILNLKGTEFYNIFTLLQVSEKRWYWLKALALAYIRDWDALDRFSKEKRPPTGLFFII